MVIKAGVIYKTFDDQDDRGGQGGKCQMVKTINAKL